MRPRDRNKEEASLRAGLRYKAPTRAVAGPGETVAFATLELSGELEGWSLEAEFTLDNGQVVHGPVTFTPRDRVPLGTLTATALRQLSLHDALTNFEDILRRLEAQAPELGTQSWIDALTAGRRPGRRQQDPSVYLLWARRRVEAERVAPERPVKWMVEQWGDQYTEASISKFIYRARDKGFLTPKEQPVALTEQATRLLEGDTSNGKR